MSLVETFKCEHCASEFIKPKRSKGYRFCSFECYWDSMKGKAIVNSGQFKSGQKSWNSGTARKYICKTCGKEFKPNSKGKDYKYCSRKCFFKDTLPNIGKWNKGRKMGLEEIKMRMKSAPRGKDCNFWNGGNWKKNASERLKALRSEEYKLWRREVFIRDDWTCQVCGKRGGCLQAHHIQPWCLNKKLRYDLDNGQTLCRSCHRKTDSWGFKSVNLKNNSGKEVR